MIYRTAEDWRGAQHKRVLLFGMSGLGKTHVSNMLREAGNWFHYSVDYRIGTRYMGEHIADNFKREAMKNPFLRDLLRSDSIYVGSNITFNNLAPLSRQARRSGQGWPAVRGIPAKAGSASPGRDCGIAGCCTLHRPGGRSLRLRSLRLRQWWFNLRGGRPL